MVDFWSLLEPSQVVALLCGAGHVWHVEQLPLYGAGHDGEASRKIYSPVGSIGVVILQPANTPKRAGKNKKRKNNSTCRKFSSTGKQFRQVKQMFLIILYNKDWEQFNNF